jgi:hypothetical protein
MADGPTASKTLGIIGVELYRLENGSVGAINMTFVAVQTDWKWIAWYWFDDDASLSDDFGKSWPGSEVAVADIYGQGFGPSNNEFRREFLYLNKAMRVDGLAGDLGKPMSALMYARNSIRKKGDVFVAIDIKRPDGILQLRRLHMEGNIPKKFDGKGIRGTVSLYTSAHIFKKQELADPPLDSAMQLP